jgi:hypothetical protein
MLINALTAGVTLTTVVATVVGMLWLHKLSAPDAHLGGVYGIT